MTTNSPPIASGAVAGTAEAPKGGARADFPAFFREFFARTVRSVEAIAGTAAEDIAQEAFIAAMVDWDRVVTLDAPDAWVRLVAKRIAWRRRHREISRQDLQAAALPPVTPTAHDETLPMDLEVALRGLPARQRAVVQLHYLGGRSVSEVAEILGCTESSAKTSLHRARERLAETMSGLAGRWISERRWAVDDIVDRMRETNDATHVDIVLSELPDGPSRWAFTLDHGVYGIDSDSGGSLDHGRYRIIGKSIVLTPWDLSGTVLLTPVIDGGRARFALTANTTAPTRDVPDEVYLRLLLASGPFTWTGSGRRSSPPV